jgi:hypothetical protein
MPPTKFEQELLALAAAERQRAETQRREAAQNSAPLSRLFSYHMARDTSEEHAAQVVRAAISARETVDVVVPHDSPVARAVRTGRDPAFSVSSRVASEPNTNEDVLPDLTIAEITAMFMNGDARAQADLTGTNWADVPDIDVTAEDPFQVEFSGEFREGQTTPNEAMRFQVGRESPPSMSMTHRDTIPTGGMVVSTRGEDGRFRPTEVGEATASAHATITALREAQRSPLGTRPATPRPEVPRGASGLPVAPERRDRTSIPTALERIAGDDMFDD